MNDFSEWIQHCKQLTQMILKAYPRSFETLKFLINHLPTLFFVIPI